MEPGFSDGGEGHDSYSLSAQLNEWQFLCLGSSALQRQNRKITGFQGRKGLCPGFAFLMQEFLHQQPLNVATLEFSGQPQ